MEAGSETATLNNGLFVHKICMCTLVLQLYVVHGIWYLNLQKGKETKEKHYKLAATKDV